MWKDLAFTVFAVTRFDNTEVKDEHELLQWEESET